MCQLPERQAGAPEIEISPQMVEAGFRVLQASGLGDVILKEDKCTVAGVYRAMLSARSADHRIKTELRH